MVTKPEIFFQTLNVTLKTGSENITTNTLKSLHDSFIAFIKNDRFHTEEKPSHLLCASCIFTQNTWLLTLVVTKWVEVFPHNKRFSVTPAGCPTI